MKKVWVNRFNADGTLKPMSEWVQRECAERYTHTYPLLNGGHGFDGGGLPAHHCFISTFGKIAESGFFYEYIGNQRGDGWFYVADGDLPPIEDNAVLCHDGYGLLLMMPADLHRKNAWNHRNKAKCWMPVTDPRHLD